MLEKLKGYRTYATLAVVLILGLIETCNGYCTGSEVVAFCRNIEIPGFVFTVLATLGIYTRKLAGTGK